MAPVPPIGILSRQIVRSRAIKYILAARIRSPKYNDLIFVYDSYLELYYHENGYERPLHPIATKDDFDCKIQAAKVLTRPEHLSQVDEDDYPHEKQLRLPHQVLVLKLDNNSLLFLHATASDVPTFETVGWPLPQRPVISADVVLGLDELLATGSDGRVMAVAGTELGLMLYNSWPHDTEAGLDKMIRDDTALILPPRLIVLKMEFLRPPASDSTRASLVLLGLEDRKTVLYIYSWDSHDMFPTAGSLQPIRHALGKGEIYDPLTLA